MTALQCESFPRTVALVGNPNCGKTTVFNALTGLRHKVGNYPGITVEKRVGTLVGGSTRVLDLPGTYSLMAASPDEQVVTDVLCGVHDEHPDSVLAVVDASNLARSLYLISQLAELGLPLVVALNMSDIAERRGQPVDTEVLARELGCDVVSLVGHRRTGIEAVRVALEHAKKPCPPSYDLPAVMQDCLEGLVRQMEPRFESIGDAERVARRLMTRDAGADLARFRSDPAIRQMLDGSFDALHRAGVDPEEAEIAERYAWVDKVVAKAVRSVPQSRRATLTDRIDAVLIDRFLGLIFFALMMGTMFAAVFWAAKPLSSGLEMAVERTAEFVCAGFGNGPLHDLLRDGVFGGVGAVLVFVPQVLLLFLALAALEDSGYLARAAFLMDRLLSKTGLHGKSFIPLLTSFGCAVPGILAARTIDSRRDRLATILVAPFMACSARLPVYALLIAACFASASALTQGLVLLALYGMGIATACAVAFLFRKRAGAGDHGSFILELPTYKVPQASQIVWQAYSQTRTFVVRAGSTILLMSIVLWGLLYYPRLSDDRVGQGASEIEQRAAQVEYSFAGRIGHGLEPALRPLGFDWKIGVGLVGAFAAREVFVSTLGVAYRVGADEASHAGLVQTMRADRYPDGRPVFTPLVGVSLMIWFVLAMQCMSTLAVVRRETGRWKWPLLQLGLMNLLAYIACACVYRFGVAFLRS